MNFALLLLAPASAAAHLTPPAPAAAPVAAVTVYNAFVATEETPATKDLVNRAILGDDGKAKSIVSSSGTRWIA
jgi:hypothetical protein